MNDPVRVLRVTYNTIREAWQAISSEGLAESTVRARLDNGWGVDEAFLTPEQGESDAKS